MIIKYTHTKDVAYSSNEKNGQNSFYKNFFVILHVNAPYPSASEFWRKKGGTRTHLVAMLTSKISNIFEKITDF